VIKEVAILEYFCDGCGRDLNTRNGNPFYQDQSGSIFCPDCALKNGAINAMEWLSIHGWSLFHHAVYEDGKVIAFQAQGRGFSKYCFEVNEGVSPEEKIQNQASLGMEG